MAKAANSINWNAIKSDYITKGLSYRQLQDIHGVSYAHIARRGRSEGWGKLRTQLNNDIVTKIMDDAVEKEVSSIDRLETVADKVLDKVEAYIDRVAPELIDTQSLKHISGILKDIKDVKRNRKDLEEQDARIEKLRREADPTHGADAPKLVVEGLPEEFKS